MEYNVGFYLHKAIIPSFNELDDICKHIIGRMKYKDSVIRYVSMCNPSITTFKDPIVNQAISIHESVNGLNFFMIFLPIGRHLRDRIGEGLLSSCVDNDVPYIVIRKRVAQGKGNEYKMVQWELDNIKRRVSKQRTLGIQNEAIYKLNKD